MTERPEVGSLSVILSTMFGGKSMMLLRLMETLGYAFSGTPHSQILYVNSTKDTRSTRPFSTHTKLIRDDANTMLNARFVKVTTLSEIWAEDTADFRVVVIDEANLYPDLVEVVTTLVDQYAKMVYVAGLKGDYRRRPFGEILNLIPHADSVIHLADTYCQECARNNRFTKAVFTDRIVDATGQQEEIGASNYQPTCRGCSNARRGGGGGE